MNILIGFMSKYLLNALLLIGLGVFSKVLKNYFGNDRADKIKEAIFTSMLWAEQEFGIGNGDQKWTKAWNKLIKILESRGIKLKEKEIPLISDMMKSNIPEINAITYTALPEKVLKERILAHRKPETTVLVNKLKTKYNKKDKMK